MFKRTKTPTYVRVRKEPDFEIPARCRKHPAGFFHSLARKWERKLIGGDPEGEPPAEPKDRRINNCRKLLEYRR
jgi:hypothetical protein